MICFACDYERLAEQLKIVRFGSNSSMLMGEEDSAPKISISGIQPLDAVQIKLLRACAFASISIGQQGELSGPLEAADQPGPGR